MIKSFKCKETEKIFKAKFSKKIPADIQRRALMKLRSMNIAAELIDLSIPPANKLESLKGDRKDHHSIRINQQWRICFKWIDDNAYDVEIIDYH